MTPVWKSIDNMKVSIELTNDDLWAECNMNSDDIRDVLKKQCDVNTDAGSAVGWDVSHPGAG
jgi:hypothetical protein